MASKPKTPRMTTDQQSVLNVRHWISSIVNLCSNNYLSHITLTPLKIKHCNATAPSGASGSSFSRAFCETQYYEEGLVFGDVFHTGMNILLEYLNKTTMPENKQLLFVLEKLLDFINGDRSFNVCDPQEIQNLTETELALLVSNHLFGKLATSSCYKVDNSYSTTRKKDQCFCGEDSCKMTGQYGDTSVGNVEVWHGNLDIIIKNDLAVKSLEDSPCSLDEKSVLSRNQQIIAQTIVFSFLQKKEHPEQEHFLTPCIGIGNSEIIVMFYDSEHDVLLESSTVPLFKNKYSCEFSYAAILVCWFTVNYKFLCTGLPEHLKGSKSDFFIRANEKLNVYEENLRMGNVCSSHSTEGNFFPPRVKCTSFLHKQEKILLEMLWHLDNESGASSDVSYSNPKN